VTKGTLPDFQRRTKGCSRIP